MWLALSKNFIERMGGRVSVESTYGKGSTFSFSVPQKVVAVPGREHSLSEKEPAAFTASDARILVVDDNDINREVVKAMLEPMEIIIDEAENGGAAVEDAKERKYDLILMDSHMPVMSGEEATRIIRSGENTNNTTPIIAITADAITGVREKLLECGMNDYLVKPIEIEQLCGMIRKYLER